MEEEENQSRGGGFDNLGGYKPESLYQEEVI